MTQQGLITADAPGWFGVLGEPAFDPGQEELGNLGMEVDVHPLSQGILPGLLVADDLVLQDQLADAPQVEWSQDPPRLESHFVTTAAQVHLCSP